MIRTYLDTYIAPFAAAIAASSERGNGHPVVVLPGFLAGPLHTRFLRETIKQAGYLSFDWEQGYNFGFRMDTDDRLSELITRLYEQYGSKVSLVGWSLGGVFAKAVAHRHPNHINRVITLGSPHRTRPEWSPRTALFNVLSDVPITKIPSEYAWRAQNNPPVPMTCIYTKTDGVIKWQDCMCEETDLTKNAEVYGTHLGMTHNPNTIKVVLDHLAS